MISLIAAVSENGVIGNHGDLPWLLPTDTKYFLDMTMGKTIVMGRTTFRLIVDKRGGKLLEGRNHVVLTRDATFTYPGVTVLHAPEDILGLAGEVLVIGGAKVYEATISMADRLYVTEVHAAVVGDAAFPVIEMSLWREVSREQHKADERNQYDFDFVVHEKC